MSAQSPVAPPEIVEEARALDRKARNHKRAEAQHRKGAQQARARIRELREQCASLGITLVIEGDGDA